VGTDILQSALIRKGAEKEKELHAYIQRRGKARYRRGKKSPHSYEYGTFRKREKARGVRPTAGGSNCRTRGNVGRWAE